MNYVYSINGDVRAKGYIDEAQKNIATDTEGKVAEAAGNSPKKLTPKLTPFLTQTPYSGCSQSAMIGSGEAAKTESEESHNSL